MNIEERLGDAGEHDDSGYDQHPHPEIIDRMDSGLIDPALLDPEVASNVSGPHVGVSGYREDYFREVAERAQTAREEQAGADYQRIQDKLKALRQEQ